MTELIVLRLIHILAGAVWVGAGVFNAVLLAPTLAGLGPTAGAVMAGLRARGMFVILPSLALLTILSGLRLMWIMSGGFSASYFAAPSGVAYAAAGAAAILTFVLGVTVARPLAVRMGALAAEMARAPDEAARAELSQQLAAVRGTNAVLGIVLTALLLASAAGMAVARYLT
jgi:uncharacterized membrane protein